MNTLAPAQHEGTGAAPHGRRDPWRLRLFVAGNMPCSLQAVERVQDFCRRRFTAEDTLEIIDLAVRPDLAEMQSFIALPSLLRVHPGPRRICVGDLADEHRLLRVLGLAPDAADADKAGDTAPALNDEPAEPGTSPPPLPVGAEAEETLRAIAAGEVDAWLTRGPDGRRLVARPGTDAAFLRLIEAADCGTATLAIDGTILYGNRCLADWLEVEPGRIAGQSLWSYLDEPGAVNVRTLMHAARGGQAADDVLVRGANGHVRLLRLSFSELSDGDSQRLGLVATDVEELRHAVTELDWYREHLEDIVLERTARLQETLHAAEAAGRAKTRFLAHISHEIRTPLNGILGMVHLMRGDALPELQAERLGKIEQSAQHLLNLLTEILELARIDAQRVTLATDVVDPVGLLQRAADMMGEAARTKDLALTIDPPPALPDGLRGDSRRLMQALLNLVGNAIKFTEHGRVTLRLVPLVQAADGVVLRFEVDDTGVGVTPELRARLFQPYERGEPLPTRRQQNGSGLGLTITRQLARLMGGDCGVESHPGGGSRFWFSVRLARGGSPQPPASAIQPRVPADARQLASRFGGCRVLLVEDDPVSTELVKSLLSSAQLEVDSAADGAVAVERVAGGERYAAVLMDMLMPRMDGLEATRRIRLLPAGSDLPILAMTALAFAEDRTRCLEAGMDDFLTKPLDPGSLYAALARWLPAGEAASRSGASDDGAAPAGG